MRFRITAGFTDPIQLESALAATTIWGENGILYELITDSSSTLLTHLSASDTIQPNRHGTELRPSRTPGVHYDVVWSPDEKLRARLLNAVHAVESHISFMADGMVGIKWDSVREELLPENAEDQAQLAVNSFHFERKRPARKPFLDSASINLLISSKLNKLSPLVTLRDFYREGTRHYWNFKWIPAFYNYYFVIEGLYAQRQVWREGSYKRVHALNRTGDSLRKGS